MTAQSGLSVKFIAAIFFMMLVYMKYHRIDDSDLSMAMYTAICPILTVLMGVYCATYRGADHKTARWIFGILLIISVFSVGIMMYAYALGANWRN